MARSKFLNKWFGFDKGKSLFRIRVRVRVGSDAYQHKLARASLFFCQLGLGLGSG